MKALKFLILILSTSLYTGCQEDCCGNPASFPRIEVRSTDRDDLLDPEIENSFNHANISFFAMKGNLRNIEIDILRSESDSGYSINATGNIVSEFLFAPGTRDFYLKLMPDMSDTITVTINSNIRTEEIRINGEVWEGFKGLITIYK